jgi:hypothetical protein
MGCKKFLKNRFVKNLCPTKNYSRARYLYGATYNHC